MTENTTTRNNRKVRVGVVVSDARIADELAATFRADAAWRDVAAWGTYRAGRSYGTAAYPW